MNDKEVVELIDDALSGKLGEGTRQMGEIALIVSTFAMLAKDMLKNGSVVIQGQQRHGMEAMLDMAYRSRDTILHSIVEYRDTDIEAFAEAYRRHMDAADEQGKH